MMSLCRPTLYCIPHISITCNSPDVKSTISKQRLVSSFRKLKGNHYIVRAGAMDVVREGCGLLTTSDKKYAKNGFFFSFSAILLGRAFSPENICFSVYRKSDKERHEKSDSLLSRTELTFISWVSSVCTFCSSFRGLRIPSTPRGKSERKHATF